jgi:hypothetical protein
MTKTSETISEDGEIITETGRVFRPGNAELLKALPPDIVQEMAKRRLEETARYKAERAHAETQQ